jgi:hypothetical protein
MMAGGRKGGGGGGRSSSSVACCVVLLVTVAADEGGTRCHAARCWGCLVATAGLGAADLLGPWCEHGPAWLLCKVGLSVRGILGCLTRQDGEEYGTSRMRNEEGELECLVVRPLESQPPTQEPIATSTAPKLYVGPLYVGDKTVGKNSVRDCDCGADEAPQAPIGAQTACIHHLYVSIAALDRSLKYHLYSTTMIHSHSSSQALSRPAAAKPHRSTLTAPKAIGSGPAHQQPQRDSQGSRQQEVSRRHLLGAAGLLLGAAAGLTAQPQLAAAAFLDTPDGFRSQVDR